MGAKLLSRATVVALVVAAVAGAVASRLVTQHQLDTRRAAVLESAQERIGDAVGRRSFYLQDVADMVGVHDDADVAEFARYAQVRAADDPAVVAVQWLRRAPGGHLAPAGDVPRGTRIAAPILLAPTDAGDGSLADAAREPIAANAIRQATQAKQAAISGPVRLAGGDQGFYIAVPVEAHRFSGEVAGLESRSAVVGLIDTRALVASAFGGDAPDELAVSDGEVTLAAIGSVLHHPVTGAVALPGRNWTATVGHGTFTTLERALPWLILAIGLGLALAVAIALRSETRRRDEALRVAGTRAAELARSTSMVQRITLAMDDCFYTYSVDGSGRVRTRFATPGWGRLLGLPDGDGEGPLAWEAAVHPDDLPARGRARERLREGEPLDLELRVVGADGEVHWLWVRERQIGREDGAVLVDGVASDISARKAVERELATSLGRVERANQELEQAHAEAERRSREDSVTGVFNRRHFTEMLARELSRARRGKVGTPAVLMLDLDHFKRVNDEYGHLTGDAALRATAERIASILRGSDFLARWGGEEFAVLAPDTDREGMRALAERARSALAKRPIEVDGHSIALTLSVGAVLADGELSSPDAIVAAADSALYRAKDAGRDCVRVWEPADVPAS